MVDLRRPDQRRSDNLSVLVRRPLSVANFVPRFLRTSEAVEPPQSFGFDDFDSDQETDAASICTRGGVRRSSSASFISLSDSRTLPAPPSTKLPPPPVPDVETEVSRLPVAVMVDSIPPIEFNRGRAESFYGKAEDLAQGEARPPTNSIQTAKVEQSEVEAEKSREDDLRSALGEDYELFAQPKTSILKKPKPQPNLKKTYSTPDTSRIAGIDYIDGCGTKKPPSLKKTLSFQVTHKTPIEIEEDMMEPFEQLAEGDGEDEDLELQKRAVTSPSLRPYTTFEEYVERRNSIQSSTSSKASKGRAGSVLRRLVSATNPMAAFGRLPNRAPVNNKREEQTRRSKSYVKQIDPELTARAGELRTLIADTRATKTVTPLFVEEAGRAPRVAFIEGEVKRVKRRRRSSVVAAPGSANGGDIMDATGGRRSSLKIEMKATTRKREKKEGKKGFGFVRRLQNVDKKMRRQAKKKRVKRQNMRSSMKINPNGDHGSVVGDDEVDEEEVLSMLGGGRRRSSLVSIGEPPGEATIPRPIPTHMDSFRLHENHHLHTRHVEHIQETSPAENNTRFEGKFHPRRFALWNR